MPEGFHIYLSDMPEEMQEFLKRESQRSGRSIDDVATALIESSPEYKRWNALRTRRPGD